MSIGRKSIGPTPCLKKNVLFERCRKTIVIAPKSRMLLKEPKYDGKTPGIHDVDAELS